jgi:hypothetical protein
LVNKILFQSGDALMELSLGETRPGQSSLETYFGEIRTAVPGVQEQVQNGIGKSSPVHHLPAKILLFRSERGGL